MFKVSDWMLFKLYFPDRYIGYSIPLVVLIIISVTSAKIIEQWRNRSIRIAARFGILMFLLLHFNIIYGAGLRDQSGYRQLYEHLRTLPKNSLIAAHPSLADYIPTFTKRKVFINFELSHPWPDKYWPVIKG